MRDGAERLRQDVSARIPSSAQLNEDTTIQDHHQLRTVRSRKLWYPCICTPFVFLLANAYVQGNRWYKKVDGRHDFHQCPAMPSRQPISVWISLFRRSRISSFGALCVSHYQHCFWLYALWTLQLFVYFDWWSCSAVEVYEALKSKNH
uniref:DUF7087 domain-containing protein n=1 Tax=Ditylenchus dipsaci TaxID=166011 RepID=A0A915DVQ1_9BILA